MKKPTQKEVYTTIIVLALALLLAGKIFHLQNMEGATIVLLIVTLVFYKIAEWITNAWLKFAMILGGINSKILLSVVFFIFLVPISFVYRLFKKDNLHLKRAAALHSNYKVRNHKFQKRDLENTW